jgi:hypothetical protein
MAARIEFENKPYKGHLSYEEEDGSIFFGRAREAEQLIAKILASPFTLIHAQSGAGKSSILNARVVPGLGQRGWTVAVARPHFNPSLSLRSAALRRIIPPPAAEARALENSIASLLPDSDPSLQQIIDQFDLLEPRDARSRSLLQAFEPGAGEAGTVRPLIFRLLQSTLEMSQFGEHLEVLLYPDGGGEGGAALDPRVRSSALKNVLAQESLTESHRALTAEIEREGETLRTFAESVYARYGRRRTQFRLVLIMDQFEEVFTRFTGNPVPGAEGNQLTWKLRISFFEELRELYEAKLPYPVHIVLSMRDEYVANLDPIRRFVRDLDSVSYHLTFLEKNEARFSIGEPARIFGYDYDEEVYQDIFNALVREDRFIEPAQLQIVCEKLWGRAGEGLAAGHARESDQLSLISRAALPEGGAAAILDNFFTEYLNELDASDDSGMNRLEALEILDNLVVAESGTRNIVERTVLENAPFRDPARRADLVGSLAAKRIIRVEKRLGGDFAEITHEFLINSIRDHIAAELNGTHDYANLRWALRAVMRYKDVDFRDGTLNLLSQTVFSIIDSNRARVFPGDSPVERILPELMLRSALFLGEQRDSLEYWMQQFADRGTELPLREILSETRINDHGRRSMSLYELAIVYREARLVQITAAQAAFVLRAQLERGRESDRDALVFWAGLVRDYAAKSISHR